MNNLTNPYEIDVLELFKILWVGKWIISAIILIVVMFGFGYSQIAQSKYRVSVPFSLEVYPVIIQQICQNDDVCAKRMISERIVALAKRKWNIKGDSLILKTSKPSDTSTYEVEMEGLDRLFASELYDEASNEIHLIETQIKGDLLATDAIVINMLNAKRLIQMYDSGKSFIIFGDVSIKKTAPNVELILILSVVLGAFLGCSYIIIRSVTKVRRNNFKSET